MSDVVFSNDPCVHHGIIAAGRNMPRQRPVAFRYPIGGPDGRRAQRACDREAQRFGSHAPHRMLPPFGGEGHSGNWQKSCRRTGSDPLESRRHGCNGSRTVWNCRQKSTRSHHACPRRTTTLGCDARRQAVKGAAAALVWSVAAVVVGIVRSGAVFMSRFPRPRARAEIVFDILGAPTFEAEFSNVTRSCAWQRHGAISGVAGARLRSAGRRCREPLPSLRAPGTFNPGRPVKGPQLPELRSPLHRLLSSSLCLS